jgi:hypothetical protein
MSQQERISCDQFATNHEVLKGKPARQRQFAGSYGYMTRCWRRKAVGERFEWWVNHREK